VQQRTILQKRKVIYEFKDKKISITETTKQDIARLFFYEMELLRFSEELKQRFMDDPSWDPL
jgi:hypothetical protein